MTFVSGLMGRRAELRRVRLRGAAIRPCRALPRARSYLGARTTRTVRTPQATARGWLPLRSPPHSPQHRPRLITSERLSRRVTTARTRDLPRPAPQGTPNQATAAFGQPTPSGALNPHHPRAVRLKLQHPGSEEAQDDDDHGGHGVLPTREARGVTRAQFRTFLDSASVGCHSALLA